jgi:hypothetical protein
MLAVVDALSESTGAIQMPHHAGGNDARLAPAPGKLFYLIGTYLYQLDVNLCRSTGEPMVEGKFGWAQHAVSQPGVQLPCWLWLMHYESTGAIQMPHHAGGKR